METLHELSGLEDLSSLVVVILHFGEHRACFFKRIELHFQRAVILASATSHFVKVALAACHELGLFLGDCLALHLDLHEIEIVEHNAIECDEVHVGEFDDSGLEIDFFLVVSLEESIICQTEHFLGVEEDREGVHYSALLDLLETLAIEVVHLAHKAA